MSDDRCHVEFIPLDDPAKAAASPSLAGLVNSGWTPLADFVVERSGKTELVLLLAPPKPKQSFKYLSAVIALSCVVGTVVGSLLLKLIA